MIEDLRAKIVDILGLEVAPDGEPDMLITYEDDIPVEGINYTEEVDEIVALVAAAITSGNPPREQQE